MKTLAAMTTAGIINNLCPPSKILEFGLVATFRREMCNTPVRSCVWLGFSLSFFACVKEICQVPHWANRDNYRPSNT